MNASTQKLAQTWNIIRGATVFTLALPAIILVAIAAAYTQHLMDKEQ